MKKKNIFIICLMIISLQINAQLSYNNLQNSLLTNVDISSTDNYSTRKALLNNQERKFFIGIMSSIDYYKYKTINPVAGQSEATDKYIGYHLGLKVQYDINEKVSIRSGIYFSKLVLKFDFSRFKAIDPIDPVLIDNNLVSITSKEYFLNLPLMVGYTIFSKGSFKLTPSLGYVLNVNFAVRDFTYYPNYTIYKDYNHLAVSHSMQLNLGCEYLIGKKYLFTLEPYLNYIIDKDNSYLNILSSPFTFGGIISVNYKL